MTPFGMAEADPARGMFMGNRGCLVDRHGRHARPWRGERWITCLLEFKERSRGPLMAPGRYTELFFLDEATAFAAGHRPCAHCRHADYQRFRRAWSAARGLEPASAEAIDRVLHEERLIGRREQRTHVERRDALPDGAMVSLDGEAYLVRGDALLPWSFAGYGAPRAGPLPVQVEVLTPPSAIEALRRGYVAGVHRTATS
jgi:hypothetical protein